MGRNASTKALREKKNALTQTQTLITVPPPLLGEFRGQQRQHGNRVPLAEFHQGHAFRGDSGLRPDAVSMGVAGYG